MQDLESKEKILDEIIAMMDEKDGERLKSHPKFAAKAVEIEPKPEVEAELESEKPSLYEEDLDPEAIKKILEMYSDLK